MLRCLFWTLFGFFMVALLIAFGVVFMYVLIFIFNFVSIIFG